MGIWIGGLDEVCCGRMGSKKAPKHGSSLVEYLLFLGKVSVLGLGFLQLASCDLESAKKLEEREKVLFSVSSKSVKGVSDQICVGVVIDLKTNGNAF